MSTTRKLTVMALTLMVLTLAYLAAPGPATHQLQLTSSAAVADTDTYTGWKGGAYACNALRDYPQLTDAQVVAWLVDHRGFTQGDAVVLVQVAHDHGCGL